MAANVGDTRLSSTLRHGGATISTVEHLMSALAGVGIDNLYVDVSGAGNPDHGRQRGALRVPAAIGGHRRAAASKRYIRVVDTVEVTEGDKWARFEPFNGFKLDFTIDFPHPVFGSENRQVVIDFADNSYAKEVARARTFGFMQDVEAMRAAGLALGGSLRQRDRAGRIQGAEQRGPALRQRIRASHKVLDAIGDIYLLGHPLIGAVHRHKSGHAPQQPACSGRCSRARSIGGHHLQGRGYGPDRRSRIGRSRRA